MNANELRIGNLVYFLGNVHEIEGLSKRLRPDVGHFLLSNIEHAQKGFHLKPIHLSEEWLVKFGFKKDISDAYVLNFKLFDIIHKYNDFYWWDGIDWNCTLELKYVHQMQNLYFALTGKELTINN